MIDVNLTIQKKKKKKKKELRSRLRSLGIKTAARPSPSTASPLLAVGRHATMVSQLTEVSNEALELPASTSNNVIDSELNSLKDELHASLYPTSSRPKLSDALSHLPFSPKRLHSPALQPGFASPAHVYGLMVSTSHLHQNTRPGHTSHPQPCQTCLNSTRSLHAHAQHVPTSSRGKVSMNSTCGRNVIPCSECSHSLSLLSIRRPAFLALWPIYYPARYSFRTRRATCSL